MSIFIVLPEGDLLPKDVICRAQYQRLLLQQYLTCSLPAVDCQTRMLGISGIKVKRQFHLKYKKETLMQIFMQCRGLIGLAIRKITISL